MKNEPVFPCTKTVGDTSITTGGLTLRDYFAAKAMQGIVQGDPHATLNDATVASQAYMLANAMLAERERDND